jgi:hypothetical protein
MVNTKIYRQDETLHKEHGLQSLHNGCAAGVWKSRH